MARGQFADDPRGLPQYTNNYEYEPMDLDGDGFLDLVTINDGEIVREQGSNRREHVFRNDGKGRFRDATAQWWPAEHNIGDDDNMVAFLDYDSDGDADFVIGSLSGPDRLIINNGKGHLTMARDVFVGADTPGTLGLALGDLDGDGRLDVIQAQGEHPTAVQERIFLGTGLQPDTAPPSISMVSAAKRPAGGLAVRARVHDRKSPSLPAPNGARSSSSGRAHRAAANADALDRRVPLACRHAGRIHGRDHLSHLRDGRVRQRGVFALGARDRESPK